jgi:hypothetical protein
MSKDINPEIVEGTFGRMKQVKDFLPRPEELVFQEEPTIDVTLTLDKASVDLFKAEAERLRVPYQQMMRNLLQSYANQIRESNSLLYHEQ